MFSQLIWLCNDFNTIRVDRDFASEACPIKAAAIQHSKMGLSTVHNIASQLNCHCQMWVPKQNQLRTTALNNVHLLIARHSNKIIY